jgi:Tol biopolymer transport system component
MVAADEDCAASYVISDEPGMRFSTGHWSPDGRTIAVHVERWDLSTGGLVESGIYLADVVFLNGAGSRPIGISNLRLAILLAGETLFSWSGDGSRIAYRGAAPDGQGGTQADILIYNRLTGETTNVTNTPALHEDAPSLSPVDDRIAYQLRVAIRGTYRFDIFTIPVAGGVPTQITYKGTTGAPQNRNPAFSPDGQYLVFVSGSSIWPLVDFDVYKIRADGSGKAVNLTGKRAGDFLGLVEWRR